MTNCNRSPLQRLQYVIAAAAVALLLAGPTALAQEQPASTQVENAPTAAGSGTTEPQLQSAPSDVPTRSEIQTPSDGQEIAPASGSVADVKLPHDLSPWSMFIAADIVVKAVMIGLAFASVVTWTIWLAKSIELAWARNKLARASRRVASAVTLADAQHSIGDQRGPARGLLDMAATELRLSAGIDDKAGVKERIASRLDGLTLAAGRDMNRGTGVLATIGSTAPFVGLFGTVWGIMNSFIGISESQTTNLAVVAPGIAEALLATAIGLVAAIPAVIIYNQFARAIASYKASVAETSAEVMRIVSRDLDRGTKPVLAQAAE